MSRRFAIVLILYVVVFHSLACVVSMQNSIVGLVTISSAVERNVNQSRQSGAVKKIIGAKTDDSPYESCVSEQKRNKE